MNKAWPAVPLCEVAAPVQRSVAVVPGNSYRTLGVKWWGEGAYERDTIDGSQTAATTLNEVQEGDLIINKIWVRHGSVAVAGPEVQGCAGSNEFPTFDLNRARVIPRWLHWYAKTRDLWQKCDALSQGTSGKNRIRPEKFLSIEIPLPPLREQRRIVAKVEELAAKIDEARGIRDNSSLEAAAFLTSEMRQAFSQRTNYEIAALQSACSLIVDCLHSNPVYSDEGVPTVRSPDVGWGTLNLAGAMRTSEVEYQRRTRRAEPLPDNLILVREGGGTGKAGIVQDGERCSLGQRVMMLRVDQERVLPKYLLHQWLSPHIQEEQLAPVIKGSASPHLNIKFVRRFNLVLPPLPEQRRIVAYLDDLQAKVDSLKALQTQSAAELDALLPSILDKAFKGEL